MDDASDSFSEVDSPGCLNKAFSLSDSVYLFEHSVSTIVSAAVPETPSPQVRRRRRHHSRTEEDVQAAAIRLPVPSLGPRQSKRRLGLRAAVQPPSPRLSPRKSKRRKVSPAGRQKEESSAPSQTTGFVPASSLDRDSSFLDVWLDPCQPSTSSSSSSSFSVSCSVSSSLFSTHGAASTSESEEVSVETEVVEVDPCGPAGAAAGQSNRDRRSSETDVGSLSFLTTEERAWLGAETAVSVEQSAPPPPEEILISSDNEDDAMVRIAQMEEDEVMARRMQEQFNREQEEPPSSSRSHQHHHHHNHMEQFDRDQQEAQSSRSHPHHHHNYHGSHHSPMFGMLSSTDWTPPWLAAVQMAALAPFLHGDNDAMTGQRRGRGSRRGSRQRGRAPQYFDDLPGSDYEALLEFEERQGTVVAKKTLSKGEINRFPTKKYDSAQSAANTRCQICFCDYTCGEELRILSCFHDYHVGCIDKWLKVNATCPVCRCNMAEGESQGGEA